MSEKYLGESIKKLGFGYMRLPMNGEEIDYDQTCKMTDMFLEKGFTYFDTAYVYIGGKSEVAIKKCLVERHPRESFQVASKLPVWMCKNEEDMERCFTESLTRAGLEFYDYYLLHALDKDRCEHLKKIGAWEYMVKIKEQGRATNIGFSFHDTADVLEEILAEYHEITDFVQLQINYVDWESSTIQGRLCYEIANKYNVPIIIMEPVKGGSLAAGRKEVEMIFKSANPDVSLSSWAMRYAASLDNIITVLSGMSNLEQMEDNCKSMENFVPLDDSERNTINEAVKAINEVPTIPCTLCRYCVDDCPQKINIPGVFAAVNTNILYDNIASAKNSFGWAVSDGGKPSDCTACRVCEKLCPQNIEIVEELKKASELLE